MQGRYATVISDGASSRVTLYDCAYFRHEDLEVEVSVRPPLAVEGVREEGEDRVALVLDGTWADIPEGSQFVFAEPELVILSQDGNHRRAFPVAAVETVGGRTLLHCSYHPGFSYDGNSEVLKEQFTPFQTVEGRAEVRLMSRVWMRSGKDRWQIRATDAVSVGERRIERTDVWVPIFK